MEPTTGSAAAIGFTALLVGAFGPVAAETIIVVISALAGSTVALSGNKSRKFLEVLKFMTLGVLVSLVLSWSLTGLLISYVPALAGPYTPSFIALCLGFLSDRLPTIFDSIANKFTKKINQEN